ncbi:MAG: penicillin-binding protein activator [Ancalomicrobiaceae bacterium]|nr:penicillin-binding protein activator [Ancalomicrobiaceae bacterium]
MSPHLDGRLSRRRLIVGGAPFVAVALVSCDGGHSTHTGFTDLFSSPVPNAPPPTAPVAGGDMIGTGTVKVALILPTSAGGQSGAIAQQLRNAGELALRNYTGANLQLILKDDGGTTEGGEKAASEAIAGGAQLIVGPLLAVSARGVAGPARQAGVPVITFTTDTSVGAKGVYLISFLPGTDVERVIGFAATQGRKSLAAIIPEDAFGAVTEAALRQSAANHDIRIMAIERYKNDPTEMQTKAQSLGKLSNQIDCVFVPDQAANAAQIVDAMVASGLDIKRVKVLGTGRWNDPSAFSLGSLNGAWFPAADPDLVNQFKAEYRAAFTTDPGPLAILGYEAVYLAAGLEHYSAGRKPFGDDNMLRRKGFLGKTGVFRFNPDGTSDRGLAVMEINLGQVRVVSPAPRDLGA